MARRKGSHLTLADRIAIEDGLRAGAGVGGIAREAGVCRYSVAREVRRRRVRETDGHENVGNRNLCANSGTCQVRGLCAIDCDGRCAACAEEGCNAVCDSFQPRPDCPRTQRAPYVCNGCRTRFTIGCKWPQWFYVARDADEAARWEASDSRAGIDCTEGQLRELVALVKPLLRKGQNLEHIWQTHMGQMPVSCRTFYRYVELGVLDVCNLDLPKKVRYRPRKRAAAPKEPPFRPNLAGHTYADFCALPSDEQASAVEMDCVVSARGSQKTILTLLFRRYMFQLMILMGRHTREAVVEALDHVELAMGAGDFARLMPMVLTDRGGEFMDVAGIERSAAGGAPRCSVHYCDPLQSQQEGRCERNHVELRKVLPKRTCFEGLTDADMSLACSHVNSYGRPSLGGAAPIGLAARVLPASLFEEFGVVRVEPDDVVMRPSLLGIAGRVAAR